MKKIALFSLVCCLGMMNAFGANQCKKSITFDWRNNNWNAGANEYLFETKSDYMDAINSGYFYECDSNDSSNCGNNSYVEVGANHVFQDRTIKGKAIYKCETGTLNDKWVKVNSTSGLTKCTKKIERYAQFQNFSADEYLYPTVKDYDAIMGRVYSQVYECDSSVCKDGTIITLPAGHVFKRKDINKQRRYKCVLATGDDQWVDITDDCDDCDNQPQPAPAKEQCTFTNGAKKGLGGVVEINCARAPNSESDARTGDRCYESCLKKNGKQGLYWSVKQCKDDSFTEVYFSQSEKNSYNPAISGFKKCVKKSKPVDPVKQKTCKEKRNTPEGRACCDLPESEATYNGRTDTCICLDANAEFKIENGRGMCVDKNPQQPGAEEPEMCLYIFSATIECKGKNTRIDKFMYLSPEKLENKNCEDFNAIYGTDEEMARKLFGDLCDSDSDGQGATSGGTGATVSGATTVDYRSAETILDRFVSNAESERSVWKNADGKFNTTRLASDITAGVVLGTVGGVVTGVVIKKNQVKKGFEALHCTVGGQKVAEWGDEFSVGLQR